LGDGVLEKNVLNRGIIASLAKTFALLAVKIKPQYLQSEDAMNAKKNE